MNVHRIARRRYTTDLSTRIHQIIYPSTYDKIDRTKEIQQTARLARQNIGRQLALDSREWKARAQLQLLDLYRQPASVAELNSFFEGFYLTEAPRQLLAVLQDLRRLDHQPSPTQYNLAMRLAADHRQPHLVHDIGEEMRRASTDDYQMFYGHLINALLRAQQPEHAYAVYLEMMAHRRLVLQQEGYRQLIEGLSDINEIDLALNLLKEGQSHSYAFSPTTHLSLLRGAGRSMHYQAYRHCFGQLTGVFGTQLTEGDFEYGLALAAKERDTEMASEILERMKGAGFLLLEQHFEPLLETLVYRHKWFAAFRTLSMMRQAKLGRGPSTLRPLVRAVAALTDGKKTVEEMADFVHSILVKSGEKSRGALDTVTLNALLRGLSMSGRPQAALDRLRWVAAPDIHSYEAVMDGCLLTKNKPVAEKCLSQLIDGALAPSRQIYQQMIQICLNQFNYEDAFVYLEAMKAHQMVADWTTYSMLVRRCARVKDPRATVALDEMRSLGYPATESLMQFINSSGREKKRPQDSNNNQFML